MDEMDSSPDTPWLPDEQMVDAVLAAGRRDIRTLGDLDRCWVVAGLSARSVVVDDIAYRLMCTPRMVKSIRARPETKAFGYVLTETSNFRNELSLASSALRNKESLLVTTSIALERCREKLNRLIDAQIAGGETCRRCGTPWDTVNTYYCGTPPKRQCRECHRARQQRHRDRKRQERNDRHADVNSQVDERQAYAGFDLAADLGFFDTIQPTG